MRQQNNFSINFRALKTQDLGANLVKLSVASTLRAFVSKHRAHVIQTLTALIKHVVLNHCTHHTSCTFRAQSQGFAIEAIFEGVHFLLHDVGYFAQAAHKKCRGFDNGRANISICVSGH
jgi:hypothetical protein